MSSLNAGLDVSLEMTSICVIDADGRIVLETKVASDPEALTCALGELPGCFERIRLEVGPLSQWHRGAEHADENLRLPDDARPGIDDAELLAGIIDKHLVAGNMLLPHRRRQPALEAAQKIAEPAVSVALRVGSATARKYGITCAQLNDWRDAARAGRFGPTSSSGFVPAVIVPEVTATSGPLMVEGRGRIEIVTANERRVIVDRDVDVEALLRIVQALERLA